MGWLVDGREPIYSFLVTIQGLYYMSRYLYLAAGDYSAARALV